MHCNLVVGYGREFKSWKFENANFYAYTDMDYYINLERNLTSVARETKYIGLDPTLSTTYSYPYNIARHLKALDVVSHGLVD